MRLDGAELRSPPDRGSLRSLRLVTAALDTKRRLRPACLRNRTKLSSGAFSKRYGISRRRT
jgi:hypothetical protein